MPGPRTLLTLALLAAAGAHAAPRAYIEISGPAFKPLPLAVAPAQGNAAGTTPFETTLKDDLAVSGLFNLLDSRSFLADPKEGLAASGIDFSKWTAIGADSLVKTNVSGDDKTLRVEARLFDVVGQKEALKASFAGRPSEARAFAHELADRLFEHFTGEKGVFRTRLAYVRRAGTAKDVIVADWDGRNAQVLTTGGLNLLPGWSPDGKRLAFTSYRDGSPLLYWADPATRAIKPFPAKGDLMTGAAWSPDGKQVALTISENGNADIWVMNADGSGLRNLTNSREIENSPCWSPDGKKLAFVSTRSGEPQIFTMSADGSGVERLTFQGKYNQTPDWSPRGDIIAFTARDERNVFDLFTVNVETKKIARLTQDQGNNEEPTFSPNGRYVVFTSTRDNGAKRLWIMSADGTNQHALGVDSEASTPAWGPYRTDLQ